MIKNKKIQLDKLAKETFSGTQVGVLLEDIDTKLGILAEGQTGLIKRMDGMEIKMDRMETKMDVMEIKMDRMEVKLDATFEAVGEIKVEVTGMGDNLDNTKKRVLILENEYSSQ